MKKEKKGLMEMRHFFTPYIPIISAMRIQAPSRVVAALCDA
jgi:hypothetical protein